MVVERYMHCTKYNIVRSAGHHSAEQQRVIIDLYAFGHVIHYDNSCYANVELGKNSRLEILACCVYSPDENYGLIVVSSTCVCYAGRMEAWTCVIPDAWTYEVRRSVCTD
jgi:hypothetical protein